MAPIMMTDGWKMASALGDQYIDEYYRHANNDQRRWQILSRTLHLIVLGYNIFGMCRVNVKFLNIERQIRRITNCLVIHAWYMTIKFGFITAAMYILNAEVEANRIKLTGCSTYNRIKYIGSSDHEGRNTIANDSISSDNSVPADMNHQQHHHNGKIENFGTASTLSLLNLLELIVGNYLRAGNGTTLMYGIYSMSFWALLAIFPTQLYYVNIRFNVIRFNLNDIGCLKELYRRRRIHIDRLIDWSRNENFSLITLSVKKTINLRELRSGFVSLHCYQATGEQLPGESQKAVSYVNLDEEDDDDDVESNQQTTNIPSTIVSSPAAAAGATTDNPRTTSWRNDQNAVTSAVPLRPLKQVLDVNHQNQPSYYVKVANANLIMFHPYMRTRQWHRVSMLIYMCMIVYFFALLMFFFGSIAFNMTNRIKKLTVDCDPTMDLLSNWTFHEALTFVETQYSLVVLSFASSFYCSYYFATILELSLWGEELDQQLKLSQLLIQMKDSSLDDSQLPRAAHLVPPTIQLAKTPATNSYHPYPHLPIHHWLNQWAHHQYKDDGEPVNKITTTTTTSSSSSGNSGSRSKTQHWTGSLPDIGNVDQYFNHFGGLKSARARMKFNMASQSVRLRRLEVMAERLASKRQTIMRATNLNLNLFLDELHATRRMMLIIIRRTSQLAFGFSMLFAATKSQFDTTHHRQVTVFLLVTLVTINFYLMCAASINSRVSMMMIIHKYKLVPNKANCTGLGSLTVDCSSLSILCLVGQIKSMLPKFHSLICSFTFAGTDHDLFEFWLRQIATFKIDMGGMFYTLYGYHISWGTILSVSTAQVGNKFISFQ